MKKVVLLILLVLLKTSIFAQNYEVLNYYLNATPVNGVKIKTNIPFTNSSQMPTVQISGFNYITKNTIGLEIAWYIYGNNFVNYGASSSGGYTPRILLSNENGKVVIFIDDKSYFQRFKVSVYAFGMGEAASWFTGWTSADEALNGTNTVEVAYTNKLGNLIVTGNTGIGTTTPQAKLDVNGNIFTSGKMAIGVTDMNKINPYSLAVNGTAIFTKAIVKSTSSWPDYVFTPTYKLPRLDTLEQFIKLYGHLPEIPKAEEVEKNGIDLGSNQALLLKKIEELTLIVIEENKRIEKLEKENNDKNQMQLK